MHFPDVKLHDAANAKYLTDMLQSEKSGRLIDSSFQGLRVGRCFCNASLSHTNSGHATVSDDGVTIVASRLSYELLAGPLEAQNYSGNVKVLHRCGYSACLNPSHLYLGTTEQNKRDEMFHARVKASMQQNALPLPTKLFKQFRRSGIQYLWPVPIDFSQELPLADSLFTGIEPHKCLTAYWMATSPEILRRKMWKAFVGPISKFQFPVSNVLNTCGQPYCINPHHLRLYIPSGSRISQTFGVHRNRKLSEEAIVAIRASTKSYAELGKMFGVHSQTIGNVKRQ